MSDRVVIISLNYSLNVRVYIYVFVWVGFRGQIDWVACRMGPGDSLYLQVDGHAWHAPWRDPMSLRARPLWLPHTFTSPSTCVGTPCWRGSVHY